MAVNTIDRLLHSLVDHFGEIVFRDSSGFLKEAKVWLQNERQFTSQKLGESQVLPSFHSHRLLWPLEDSERT